MEKKHVLNGKETPKVEGKNMMHTLSKHSLTSSSPLRDKPCTKPKVRHEAYVKAITCSGESMPLCYPLKYFR